MRVIRPLAGLLLGAVAILLLVLTGLGWQAGRHRDATGAFSAELTPVRTDGYAIVVADLAGVVRRHGLARLLAPAQLRVHASSTTPVVLALAPATEVNRYLEGVGRTTVTGVGYGVGAQPVAASSVFGSGVAGPLPQRPSWTVAADGLDWSVQTGSAVSLVVLRADGRPGLTATLTASLTPPGWAWSAGSLTLATGLVLSVIAVFLVRPGRRERIVVVQPPPSGDGTGWVIGGYGGPAPYDPNAYDPSAYDPNAYDPSAWDPRVDDPSSWHPGADDPHVYRPAHSYHAAPIPATPIGVYRRPAGVSPYVHTAT